MEGLVFGWRSAILGVASVQILVLSAALFTPLANRTANRTLALLLIILVGLVTPWTIGFAGFYDKWRWLTFAPFQISLAVAPLLWLYVHALTTSAWPRGAWLHLLPAALQFAFLSFSFMLPLGVKERWADLAGPVSSIVFGIGTIAGLVAYGVADLRLLKAYRHRLADERSDDALYSARWLTRAIGAMLTLLPVWSIYAIWDAMAPLGYWHLLGLYAAIALFGVYLAIEGWRHAHLHFPSLTPAIAADSDGVGRDWYAQALHWAALIEENGWVCDPDLSLGRLARRLGTNTNYLSRALNEGLGQSFSGFVNGLRSDAVARAIDRGDRRDLLTIALDAGFASKASFNRAFQARFEMSPSAYRRRASYPE